MREPVSFERKQRLRLRPQGRDQELVVEVLGQKGNALCLRLDEPALWLEDHHLEGGVELAFWRDGARHIAEKVPLMAFDLDRGLLNVERPRQTRVVQRRQTFRESVEVPVRFAPADQLPETQDLGVEDAVTQDLGGGGLCIQSLAPLTVDVDDELQLELQLPTRKVRARGRVRWSACEKSGSSRIGVAFTRITEREQDLVYGYLFEVQRNRLRSSA